MLKDNGDIKPWDGKKTRKDISNLKTKNLELMETEKRRGSWVEFGVWWKIRESNIIKYKQIEKKKG